ncbi:MAG: very short patch repair endonuclease [Candidatus Hydrogenedentota bacterium]
MSPNSDSARSRTMRQVKDRDTAPEMMVRREIHRLGYRYRLHRKDLPGKPDLVFPGRRKVIFVHGCFWHGHDCARGARVPKTNQEYWTRKIARNVERDRLNRERLHALGWDSMVVWECELKDKAAFIRQVQAFLDR